MSSSRLSGMEYERATEMLAEALRDQDSWAADCATDLLTDTLADLYAVEGVKLA